MKGSLPRAGRWHAEYAKEGNVVVLGLHTVFEAHGYQTPEKLKAFLKEKKIEFPVGVDKYKEGEKTPETMKKYRTGGTPCTVVVDKKGVVRFKKFGHVDETSVKDLVTSLLAEPSPENK